MSTPHWYGAEEFKDRVFWAPPSLLGLVNIGPPLRLRLFVGRRPSGKSYAFWADSLGPLTDPADAAQA